MIQFDGCIWLQPPTRLFTMYIYIYISQHIPTYIPPKKTQPEVTSNSPRLPRRKGSFAPSTAFNRMRHAASALVNAGESPISPASWVYKTTRGFFVVLGVVLEASAFMVVHGFRDVFFGYALGFFFVGLEFWVGKCFWCCQFCGEDIFVYKCFIKWLFVCGVYGYRPYTRGTHYETDWRGFWIWDWGVQAGSMP